MAHSVEEALTLAERIGYPVIVRPSFVIGGLAIDFCYSPTDLARQLAAATVVDPDRPVRDRPLPRGDRGRRRRRLGRRARADPGAPRARRTGGRPLGRLGRDLPAADRVSEGDQALIVATMERIVLALGARGLVNAQFIVRDDGVYLIEVNPRASRTVPFLSKVTGVPMVELAVRISLGATLPELGWNGGHLAPPAFVAVKAPAFSTAKLRGVDPSVGPGMQSTGEVIGIHTDPRVALAKALLGAALVPPRPGADGALALLSIADRDKELLPRLAAALAGAGYRLAATPGHARGACRARVRGPAGRQARGGCRRGRRRGPHPRPDRGRRGPPRRQHPDAALGCRPRRRRHPAGRDRRGDPVPDRHRDRGRRRRGARPGDRRPAVEVRSLDEWVPAGRWWHAGLRSAGLSLGRRRRRDCGHDRTGGRRAGCRGHDVAWPSDHRVSVVRPTMTTASGICRNRRSRAVIPRGASAAATTWPPHAPSMWPPTTAASWTVHTRPGRQPGRGRREEGRPEQVPALLERVGDGDDDPLAVDEQVRQVVGDEVAERDRQQPGADRAEPDRPGDREGQGDDDPEQRDQQQRPDGDARRAEQVEERLGLRQPVEDDR